MAMIYHWLHDEAIRQGVRMWKLTPKVHLVQHSCEWQQAEWGNASYYWCYGDEDLVGLCTEAAGSLHPKTMSG
eukprot:8244856-Pyramimonas_sp.AAC.1